ncbi:MAG TPA: M36 family metallopeptidase [Jiangellaceae bacterium]
MASRRLLTIAAAATLVISGAAFSAPAASGGVIASEQDAAAAADPEDLAIDHVQQHADDLGVSSKDVIDVVVLSSYTSRHTGVTHVNVLQQFRGLEVFGGHATVNIMPDGSVLYVGNSLVSDLREASPDTTELDAVEAVEAAAEELDLAEPSNLRVIRAARTAGGETILTGGGISDEPIPATLGWQPTDDGLRLAWRLVIDDSSDVHLFEATIDATTGELLSVEDWTSDHSVSQLAAQLGRAPSALAGGLAAQTTSITPGTTDPVNDGSSYRVYAPPKESPNDGGRTLETNPADATASPFGWHDTDGVPGPEFTITRGNNVHAYTDHNNSNSPEGGISRFVVDPPSPAAGEYSHTFAAFGPRAAPDNFAGEIVLVDDGDGDGFPNNGCQPFTVPADAIALLDRGECNFTVKVANAQAGGASAVVVANNVPGNPITMGGADPTITIPAIMVSMADGNTIKDGLPASGRIEIIDPGLPTEADGGPGLTFDFPLDLADHPHEYVEAATTNLFYWCNTAHDLFYKYGFDEPSGNFQANNYGRGGVGGDYVRCEAQDGGGTNNANFSTPANDGGTPRMQMYLWSIGPDPQRDGDLESGIIFHEYGHGLSLRLTGGPGVNCLAGVEQMGEGWSDYVAIAGLIDPALDDPQGPRGMGTYALWQDDPPRQGAGIRPRPYSRNMDIQPFTYDSIKTGAWFGGSLAVPHHIGHGWASILWDMTWDLIDKHGFSDNIYEGWQAGGNNLAYQLVIDGLKLQGCFPGFVTGRDAILAADVALTGGENQCTIWASFARRGLGYSAEQGAFNDRNDNDEAFDTHPDCLNGFQSPLHAMYGELNTAIAGDVVPLRFNAGGGSELDILASGSPYSREVDCESLHPVSQLEDSLTPRSVPVAAETPGNTGLTVNRQGVYTYPWQTDEQWAGTCQELVLTRDDGDQHRAFFAFVEAD